MKIIVLGRIGPQRFSAYAKDNDRAIITDHSASVAMGKLARTLPRDFRINDVFDGISDDVLGHMIISDPQTFGVVIERK